VYFVGQTRKFFMACHGFSKRKVEKISSLVRGISIVQAIRPMTYNLKTTKAMQATNFLLSFFGDQAQSSAPGHRYFPVNMSYYHLHAYLLAMVEGRPWPLASLATSGPRGQLGIGRGHFQSCHADDPGQHSTLLASSATSMNPNSQRKKNWTTTRACLIGKVVRPYRPRRPRRPPRRPWMFRSWITQPKLRKLFTFCNVNLTFPSPQRSSIQRCQASPEALPLPLSNTRP